MRRLAAGASKLAVITLDGLRAAIDAADWPRALGLALAAWRETRAVSLTGLVDALAQRCRVPPPPMPEVLQRWWIERAATYDPVTATALLGQFEVGAQRSDLPWNVIRARYPSGSNPVLYAVILGSACTVTALDSLNVLDRLAAMVAWPDDPRVARVLVRVLATLPLPWNPGAMHGLFTAIADWLVRLGDAGVRPLLEACAAEPRGGNPAVRAAQQAQARRALEALPDAAGHDFDPQVRSWCAQLDGERATPQRIRAAAEAALWTQIADAPDDLAPRVILADLLVERGDARGELIALQCSGKASRRVRRLIHDHWHAWLGDLALVVSRNGTVFERGMLAAIQVGEISTPEWAFAKVRGHRELAVVDSVTRGHASPAQYAELIAGLRRLPTRLQIDAPALIAPLRAVAARWPTTALHYAERDATDPDHEPERALDLLATMFPEVATLTLAPWRGFDDVASRPALIASLPARFPKLRRIVIDLQGLRVYEPGTRGEFEAIAGLPLVEWLDPRQLPVWPQWTLATARDK